MIKQMVADLLMPLQVTGVPTGRADDGLALSSRNQYLTADERQQAPALYRCLTTAANRLARGETDIARSNIKPVLI